MHYRFADKLGFHINYNKLVWPSQKLTFLGIKIDSRQNVCKFTSRKITGFTRLLNLYIAKRRASKSQLQQLTGKLSYSARIIFGSRNFFRCIIDAMCQLKAPHHKICLQQGPLREDLDRWIQFMSVFNSHSLILHCLPIDSLTVDAYNNTDWRYMYVN